DLGLTTRPALRCGRLFQARVRFRYQHTAAEPYQGGDPATISPLTITGSDAVSAFASSTLDTANTNRPRQPSALCSKGPASANFPCFDSRSMLAKWPLNIA